MENQTNDVDWKWIELNKYQQKRCCRCMRAQRASQYTIATKKMTKKKKKTKANTNTNEAKRIASKKSVNRDECVLCEVSKKSPVRKASKHAAWLLRWSVHIKESHVWAVCADNKKMNIKNAEKEKKSLFGVWKGTTRAEIEYKQIYLALWNAALHASNDRRYQRRCVCIYRCLRSFVVDMCLCASRTGSRRI